MLITRGAEPTAPRRVRPRTGSGDDPTSATPETDELEVVSWWTFSSEAAALDALLAEFRRENPDVDAVNAAVAGGAGSAAIAALARRLRRGDPPDVWQTSAARAPTAATCCGSAPRRSRRGSSPTPWRAGCGTTRPPPTEPRRRRRERSLFPARRAATLTW